MKKLISFFEVPATDFKRAVRFYENVLCIQLPTSECEDEKMAFFPEEDGVLIHFNVDNMEETILRIEENGGKIVREKTKIEAEGMGYFALFTDCEGNRLGLYSDN